MNKSKFFRYETKCISDEKIVMSKRYSSMEQSISAYSNKHDELQSRIAALELERTTMINTRAKLEHNVQKLEVNICTLV